MAAGQRLAAAAAVLVAVLLAACQAPFASAGSSSAPSVPGYHLVRDLPMPGGTSRWDYQLFDQTTGRLYAAHMGAGQVVVVDTARQRVAAVVPGVDHVHGLALATDVGRLYAAMGESGQVAVIDLDGNRVIGHVAAGAQPDSLTYADDADRVYVSDAGGNGDGVVDAHSDAALPTVGLGGTGIGDSRYDPFTGLVLIAVGSREELDAVDARIGAVVARYPLPGCEGAHGVQVDESTMARAFVACQGNGRLVTVDLDSGRVIGQPLPVAAQPDVVALDPELQRLYVASQSGVLTVIDTSAAAPIVLTQGWAGPDAHSVTVDPDTHLVYLPLTDVGGHPVLRELLPDQ